MRRLGRHQRATWRPAIFSALFLGMPLSCAEDGAGSKNQRQSDRSEVTKRKDSGDENEDPLPSLVGTLIQARYKVTVVVSPTAAAAESVRNINKKMPPLGNGQSVVEKALNQGLEAKNGTDIVTCTRSIEMKVNVAFGASGKGIPMFEIDNAVLPCQMGPFKIPVDLGQILSVFGAEESKPKLTVEGDIVYGDRLGDGLYSPGRPIIPSFLASKRENLAKLDVTKEGVSLTSSKTGANATGSIQMRTLSLGAAETSPAGTFPDVFKFEVTATGFQHPDIIKMTTLLPDRMVWTMSLTPIAFLRIHFESSAADLAKAAAVHQGVVGGPLGKVLDGVAPIISKNETLTALTEGVLDNFSVAIDMELEDQEGLKK